MDHLGTIPGSATTYATAIIVEIGIDTANRNLRPFLLLGRSSPENSISAGKKSTQSPLECAWSAVRMHNTYLSKFYWKLNNAGVQKSSCHSR
jgi:transposase